jgi:hypothetical protein
MRRSNSVQQMLANKLSLKLCCLDADKTCPWEIQNHQRDRSELVNKKREKLQQNTLRKSFAARYRQYKFLNAKLVPARWGSYGFEFYENEEI